MARPGNVNLHKQTESRFGIRQNYITIEERKFRQKTKQNKNHTHTKKPLVLKNETKENLS